MPFWPALTALGFVLLAWWLGAFQSLELKALDMLLRLRLPEPTDERILIIGIDETDIQQVGSYPIPDEVLAALLQKLETYHPRVVGLDMFRDLPVEPGHRALVDTLVELPNVIGIETVGKQSVSPPPMLPPERIGFVDLPLDEDGFVRRVLLGVHGADRTYRFAFAVRLAETYLMGDGITLENGQKDPIAMRFGAAELTRVQPNTGAYVRGDAGGNQILFNPRAGDEPFRIVSLRQVMADQVPLDWVQDAVVLIGVTSLSAKDLVNSATLGSKNPGLVYGVEFQAHATSQIINAALDGRPLLEVWPDGLEYSWITVWGLLGIGLALASRRLGVSVLGGGVALGVLVVTGIGLITIGIWVPVLVPAIAFILTSAVTTCLQLMEAQQQQHLTMRLLGQQTSPEIAQALWAERHRLTDEGRLPAQGLTATILFSDIRGFTALSEQQPPPQVMGWLNDYFMAMTDQVQRHHGVVNKFLGDGLMAVFGVPIPRTTTADIAVDAQWAVECALAMEHRLEQLNQRWQDQGLEPIQIRIGIYTGPVMGGSLGGPQRLEYAVIGDSVNTASRLEGCMKHRQSRDCRILIADETLIYLNNQFEVEPWGEVPLRGKQNTVRVYQVLGKKI